MHLGEETVNDFLHLFEAAKRLEQMLVTPDQAPNTHDLMNVLTALRGYAEMLRDDVGAPHPGLDAMLSSLLATVQGAHSFNAVQSAAATRVIQSDPGFILAVDDLQENRELVARNLSRIGHIVITAASGEEALRALEQSDVDVVLLDLLMPGVDGALRVAYAHGIDPEVQRKIRIESVSAVPEDSWHMFEQSGRLLVPKRRTNSWYRNAASFDVRPEV